MNYKQRVVILIVKELAHARTSKRHIKKSKTTHAREHHNEEQQTIV